ncbi:Uncharacterized protein Fot_17031 [Forsythia ovata]|uniref:Uncharacterized protein n=1 Tax=Forsythia ovata TaxID=205694 RepID=A0ABD1VGR9_9LAMI
MEVIALMQAEQMPVGILETVDDERKHPGKVKRQGINLGYGEDFLESEHNSCKSGWLSPRISFSYEFLDEEASKVTDTIHSVASENAAVEKPEESNRNVSGKDFVDFEFRLEDPVTMLPADKLFFDGKLVPLQLSTIRYSMTTVPPLANFKFSDTPKLRGTNFLEGAFRIEKNFSDYS